MKTVIVGGSKILIALILVCTLAIAALLLWLKFGIRPFDRLSAQIGSLANSDPDASLAMYPQLFALGDKDHVVIDRIGMAYSQRGRLLARHFHNKQAIEDFKKAIELNANGWHGITKACALLDIANCQLDQPDYKVTKADINSVIEASRLHPTLASLEDKDFWPAYEQSLGRMYARVGDYPNALKHLQLSVDEYKSKEFEATSYPGIPQGWILDTLIRAGRYAEANKKFIELASDPASGDAYQLRHGFRQALLIADNKDPGFDTKILAMLEQKQFAELDKMADEMRTAKKILPDGLWTINQYYKALDWDHYGFEADWRRRINLLEQWTKARPQSATAKIALGRLLVSYAWDARGNGWGNSVSETGWKKFGDRLVQAKAVLDQVKEKPADWYNAAQKCALGQGMERGPYDAMVAQCRKLYPDYDVVVFLKSYYLQPRWNGQEGESESYLAAEANKRGGPPGDMLYARSAWFLDDGAIDNVMNETNLSWPRVKSGLKEIVKEFPDSLMARGELSIMAMQKKDIKTGESAFDGCK